MANVGYQESEIFARAENNMFRLPKGSIKEGLDLALQIEADGPATAVALGQVEYDMDEQDERWLDAINQQRHAHDHVGAEDRGLRNRRLHWCIHDEPHLAFVGEHRNWRKRSSMCTSPPEMPLSSGGTSRIAAFYARRHGC
jgi:hypothetical protein